MVFRLVLSITSKIKYYKTLPLGAKTFIRLACKKKVILLNFSYLMVCWRKLNNPHYRTCRSNIENLQTYGVLRAVEPLSGEIPTELCYPKHGKEDSQI
jgi:hypothetical protein